MFHKFLINKFLAKNVDLANFDIKFQMEFNFFQMKSKCFIFNDFQFNFFVLLFLANNITIARFFRKSIRYNFKLIFIIFVFICLTLLIYNALKINKFF